MTSSAAKPKIGLVLGGGGALGYAHVGVIKALEEENIYPDVIAGSSMGAIIGVLYAGGYDTEQILEIIQKDHLYKVNKLLTVQNAFSTSGMSSHKALKTILKSLLPANSFDSLKIPMYVCVTDVVEGVSRIKHKGDKLAEYVAASASIPGVFETENLDGKLLVDGGVLNNMPAIAIKNEVDVIIGIDVLPVLQTRPKNSALDIALASIRIMQHQNSLPGRQLCTYLIEPKAIEQYHEFSFDKYREIYQYGYLAAKEYIHSHPDMVRKLANKK